MTTESKTPACSVPLTVPELAVRVLLSKTAAKHLAANPARLPVAAVDSLGRSWYLNTDLDRLRNDTLRRFAARLRAVPDAGERAGLLRELEAMSTAPAT
jgi:hypothetical protein